jgi:NADH:ubiquinone oxidoreductase subunit 6 (subunit J)
MLSYHDVLFWLVGLMTALCAITVVVTQNIVRAAVWLLFTLAGTAALFFLLGADFVGATQLLVYVGGILILVLFGVMLTAQGPFISMKAGAGEWGLTIVVGLVLYGLIAVCVLTTDWTFKGETNVPDVAQSRSANNLGGALLGIEDFTPKGSLSVANRERSRMSYLLPFEIVSVHLLVVLLGAAYLARAKRRRGASS